MFKPKGTKSYTPLQIRQKLEKYCAYQERSHLQVFRKCKEYGLSDTDSNEILVELIRSNFLNEERFAEAYVRGKFKIMHWGENKIVQGLKQAGVSDALITKSLKQLEFVDQETAILKLAQKKWNQLKSGSDFEKKQKVYRYLISKGYSFQQVQTVVEQL